MNYCIGTSLMQNYSLYFTLITLLPDPEHSAHKHLLYVLYIQNYFERTQKYVLTVRVSLSFKKMSNVLCVLAYTVHKHTNTPFASIRMCIKSDILLTCTTTYVLAEMSLSEVALIFTVCKVSNGKKGCFMYNDKQHRNFLCRHGGKVDDLDFAVVTSIWSCHM